MGEFDEISKKTPKIIIYAEYNKTALLAERGNIKLACTDLIIVFSRSHKRKSRNVKSESTNKIKAWRS